MNNASPATRNLLKYGIVLALFLYLTYSFVSEYLAGTMGFTLPVFIIGMVILGGGTVFSGVLTLKAWRESQAEAAAALDAEEAAKAQLREAEEE